jgi:hypothetical protein
MFARSYAKLMDLRVKPVGDGSGWASAESNRPGSAATDSFANPVRNGRHARGDHKGRPYSHSGQLASAAVTGDGGGFLRNSDHAFDTAHDGPNRTADDAANHGAYRTGRPLTDGDTLLASTDNPLGLGRQRRRKNGNNDNGHGELRLHKQTPLLMSPVSMIDAKRLISHYGVIARRMWPLINKIAAL